MIGRVRYKARPVKPLAQKGTVKDALGAQSFQMRDRADHKVLQKAGVVWQSHQAEEKKRWTDWTEILGPALVKVQEEAMAIASTNKPEGKPYTQAVSGLLKTYRLDEINCSTRSHAINIAHNLEAVTKWRAKQGKPERLNHPTTVWRAFALSDEWHAIQLRLGIEPKKRKSSPKLRGALATLLANQNLTRNDLPKHATFAALTKLATQISDLAMAVNRVSMLEGADQYTGGTA